MGLLDRLRGAASAFRGPELDADIQADIAAVRRAIRAESERRGVRAGLSLTLLMEHSDEDLRRLDLFQILAHLQAEGELANLVQDSFGNIKFDLARMLPDD